MLVIRSLGSVDQGSTIIPRLVLPNLSLQQRGRHGQLNLAKFRSVELYAIIIVGC